MVRKISPPSLDPVKEIFGRRPNADLLGRSAKFGLKFVIRKYFEHLTPLGYLLDAADIYDAFHPAMWPQRGVYGPGNGWQLLTHCSSPPFRAFGYLYHQVASNGTVTANSPPDLCTKCLAGQGWIGTPHPMQKGTVNGYKGLLQQAQYLRTPQRAFDYKFWYHPGIIYVNTPAPAMQHWPETAPQFLPWPALDPMSMPIGKMLPDPQSLPWRSIPRRAPNPFRAPGEQSEWGYEVETKVDADALPESRTLTRDNPSVRSKPRQKPGRPGKGTKEVKRRAGPALRALLRVIGQFTEYDDAVRGLFNALPQRLQDAWWKKAIPGKNGVDQAKYVYDNLDHVDIWQALLNVSYNELEDMAYGLKPPGTRSIRPTRMGASKDVIHGSVNPAGQAGDYLRRHGFLPKRKE